MIQHEIIHTPLGVRISRAISSGLVTRAEMQQFVERISQNGEHHGIPLLVVLQTGVEHDDGAREQLKSLKTSALMGRDDIPIGVVVTQPVMRTFIKFLCFISGTRNAGVFSTEKEALRFIDGQSVLKQKTA